jgi:hypothetical protein
MSISASIDIQFARRKEMKISKVMLVKRLLEYGWTFRHNGYASYLPIGDNDDFNFQREAFNKESIDALMMVIKKKEELDEPIVVSMTWERTNVGGELLLIRNGEISINLSINRKLLDTGIEKTKNTDVNWYLMRLLPVFNCEELMIESFSYSEHL